MYDFHKTKQGNSEQAFKHQNFRKDDYNLLASIKRKSNNEAVKKEEKAKRKKFDFEMIKKEAVNICGTLDELKNRVECLEGKHSFLEICHSQLVSRNHKIKLQLSALIDKEKNLENLLLFALKNFAPNLFFKNNELKYWESILPELGQDNLGSNVIVEKSAFQKNDVLNKIFKELKNLIHCYRIIDNTEQTTDNPEIISSVKINPLNSDKKEETQTTESNNESNINKSNVANNVNNVNNEINDSFYYNQFTDWQKRIYDNFEENIKSVPDKENANHTANVNKFVPRVNNNLQIVKRMADELEKIDELNNPSAFFEVVTQKDIGVSNTKFVGKRNHDSNKKEKTNNKRKRPIINEDENDLRHFNSDYKIEKKYK